MIKRKYILINKDELPRWNGDGKGKNGSINYEKCVGIILKFKDTFLGCIYEIKPIKYIRVTKIENKKTPPQFIIEYIHLNETITYKIDCDSLINGCHIGRILPSLNNWTKENDYWIGSVICKNNILKFSFNTDNKETEYRILHSTWRCDKDGYLITKNDNKGHWKLHRAIMFDFNLEASKGSEFCVDHINKNKQDNRKSNLRLATRKENSENRKSKNGELVCLRYKNGKWFSEFKYKNTAIITKCKDNKLEAEIDNLIAQKHLDRFHNKDQFYKIDNLPKERIEEVINLINRRIKIIDSKEE